jgi:hypothetical protein
LLGRLVGAGRSVGRPKPPFGLPVSITAVLRPDTQVGRWVERGTRILAVLSDLADAVDDVDISAAPATSAANCEKLGDRASCSSKTRSIDAADRESQSSENHNPQSIILA